MHELHSLAELACTAILNTPEALTRPRDEPQQVQVVIGSEHVETLLGQLRTLFPSGELPAAAAQFPRLATLRPNEHGLAQVHEGSCVYVLLLPWQDAESLTTVELGALGDSSDDVWAHVRPLVRQARDQTRALMAQGVDPPLLKRSKVNFDLAAEKFQTPSYEGGDRRAPDGPRQSFQRRDDKRGG